MGFQINASLDSLKTERKLDVGFRETPNTNGSVRNRSVAIGVIYDFGFTIYKITTKIVIRHSKIPIPSKRSCFPLIILFARSKPLCYLRFGIDDLRFRIYMLTATIFIRQSKILQFKCSKRSCFPLIILFARSKPLCYLRFGIDDFGSAC